MSKVASFDFAFLAFCVFSLGGLALSLLFVFLTKNRAIVLTSFLFAVGFIMLILYSQQGGRMLNEYVSWIAEYPILGWTLYVVVLGIVTALGACFFMLITRNVITLLLLGFPLFVFALSVFEMTFTATIEKEKILNNSYKVAQVKNPMEGWDNGNY